MIARDERSPPVAGPSSMPKQSPFAWRPVPFALLFGALGAWRSAPPLAAANRTDALVGTLPSLDDGHPLPEAPWFEPGARWSARRALLHIVAETAQHAGHADIVRESIDGQKTMG